MLRSRLETTKKYPFARNDPRCHREDHARCGTFGTITEIQGLRDEQQDNYDFGTCEGVMTDDISPAQRAYALQKTTEELSKRIPNQIGKKGGSTLCAVFIKKIGDRIKITVCNVGDSRAYLVLDKKGGVTFLL